MNGSWVDSICFEPSSRRAIRPATNELQITARLASPLRLQGLVTEFAGVLYDDTAWQRWLLQQLAKIGLQTQYGPFFQVFERDYLPAVHCGRDYWEALRDFLVASGLTRGQIDEVEAAGQSRYHQFEECVRPLPGVTAALMQFAARNVPIAILSNSPYTAQELQRRLSNMGIADRFVTVLSSRDLGFRKPDRASYEAALHALHLPPNATAYIGKKEDELRGAAKAGLTTIAINYEPGTRADILIDRFDQLPRAIWPEGNAKIAG